MSYFQDSNNPWFTAWLNREIGHFTGASFAVGTEVSVRRYPADERYYEVMLPDSNVLTIDHFDVTI